MNATKQIGLIVIIIYVNLGKGSELRNFSKGVKAFYDLADSDLQTDDFLEIMEYLDQRFYRKCFSVESSVTTDIKTKDVLDIMSNMQAEMKKLSSDIVDDRTRFQNEMSEIKERFVVFKNESKMREAKTGSEYMSSNLFCQTQDYMKCLAGDCCIATEVTFPNLALGKEAWQSSEYGGCCKADAAVDGNRASIIHTKYEANPWWMVDLETEKHVSRVVIVNRADGSWTRLRNVVVTVSSEKDQDGEVCGRFDGPGTAGQIIEINCAEKLRGRYVKLTMSSKNYLHVGEVEVYSK